MKVQPQSRISGRSGTSKVLPLLFNILFLSIALNAFCLVVIYRLVQSTSADDTTAASRPAVSLHHALGTQTIPLPLQKPAREPE